MVILGGVLYRQWMRFGVLYGNHIIHKFGRVSEMMHVHYWTGVVFLLGWRACNAQSIVGVVGREEKV